MVSTTVPPTVDSTTTSTDRAPGSRWAGGRPAWTSGRVVFVCAAVLVLAQIASRIWIVDHRWLFGDDLALISQATHGDLLSREFLVDARGGHFVPGALLLSGWLARLAPLEWWPFAIASVLLAAAASLAVWRMLRVFLGDRPAMVVPLVLYLSATVNLGGYTWWSAAMQTVPLQIGIAWVVADAVLYLRTRRTRYAVTAPLALVVTLLFSERAVTVPFLALGVLAVLLHVEGVLDPLRETWRRTRPLWVATSVVMGGWALAFREAVPAEAYNIVTVTQLIDTVRYFIWHLLPGLAGGPWEWAEFRGSTPIAETPHDLFVASVLVAAALVLWTCLRRRGALLLWLVAIAFVAANGVLLGLGRGAFGAADFFPLAYRYYPAEPVLLAIVVALLFLLPLRTSAPASGGVHRAVQQRLGETVGRVRRTAAIRVAGRLVVPALTVLVVAGSMVSTVRHVDAWSEDPAEQYFATAREELANAGESPLFDQAVPAEIMWALGAPYNSTGTLFRPFSDRPEFGTVTDRLRMFDATGRLRPAQVDGLRSIAAGPLQGCGWGVQPGGRSTDVALTGPFISWNWTAQLNYLAGDDGFITVTLGSGPEVRVPVERGAHTVYLQILGDGDHLSVTSDTDDLGVCIDSGVIGRMELA